MTPSVRELSKIRKQFESNLQVLKRLESKLEIIKEENKQMMKLISETKAEDTVPLVNIRLQKLIAKRDSLIKTI